MSNKFLKIFITFAATGLMSFSFAGAALADTPTKLSPNQGSSVILTPNITGLTDSDLGIQYGAGTGLTNADPRIVAARIIRASMQILGILALVIVLYGGFTWMTAGGNEEKVGEAKKWLFAGVIGLVIILSAYALTSFVISRLVGAMIG